MSDTSEASAEQAGTAGKPGGAGAGHLPPKQGFAALMLGAIGVVFGDIGTSPLYAMRVALSHSPEGDVEMAVLGVVSLVLWALTLIVTVKYVVFLMRADNKGEGGTLALMALAQRAVTRRGPLVFFIGVIGAALFYGDGVVTPAISVLSAVEGLKEAPGVGPSLAPFILPIAAVILIGLFLVQSMGTGKVAALFGPITLVWFLTLAGLGLYHLFDDPSVFRALNPYYALHFLAQNGVLGFVILGSVFLAVTGAEALYIDMGHFGKNPIRAAWLVLIFPCLALNYLGQASMVLDHPETRTDPFWQMVPQAAYWPVLVLATGATVIASQAVITGAFSMTQQAVQLGLLPRMDIRRTSETQAGQIFVPSVNNMMLAGVLLLLVVFGSSTRLASAYGIAVTGTMLVDTLLAAFVVRQVWRWTPWQSAALIAPLLAVDLAFLSSNILKIPAGGWVPVGMGATLVAIMWTWTRGTALLTEKVRRESVRLDDLIDTLSGRPPHRAPGTAIFLTSDPDYAPVALMHNLKHNKVLHEKNVMLTVKTADIPRVSDADRLEIEPINADFTRVTVNYGFMESPNVPRALALCRKRGLKFDIMSTSFFLGRRSVVPSAQSGMPVWQDRLFIFLMKNAANPTEFFKIPPGRVVEMGTQVTV